jgi:hypothetical protein
MAMRTGPDFGQILEEKLDDEGLAWVSSPRRRERPPLGPAPRPVFLFGDLRSGFTAGPSRPAPDSGASPWTPVYGARPGAQSRPPRHLTPAQRHAFVVLRGLGAGSLTERFTNTELRSAFRELARRFHPDRHPDSSESERAQLAHSFATACDAYRTLTTTAVH